MFLLVPAYPVCPGSKAVKRSLYSLWQMAGGEWQEGSGVQLPVTPVPSMSSGPFWQLKLNVCVPSASSNSYKSLQLSECY